MRANVTKAPYTVLAFEVWTAVFCGQTFLSILDFVARAFIASRLTAFKKVMRESVIGLVVAIKDILTLPIMFECVPRNRVFKKNIYWHFDYFRASYKTWEWFLIEVRTIPKF